MFKVRIIPCLDVKEGSVVKGVQFQNHEIVGDILSLAERYCLEGADELVFYDITASSDDRIVNPLWINRIAQRINIPFCVAGGIKNVKNAEMVLENGADKVSINSPAVENPELINELAKRFGVQCVVVGVDSLEIDGEYFVHQYTGSQTKTKNTGKNTLAWACEVADRGAGEIVLNCMNQDGVRRGYDITQLAKVSNAVNIPVVASGGAGNMIHFKELFDQTKVTGALAASVFHKNLIKIKELKSFLKDNNIPVRIC